MLSCKTDLNLVIFAGYCQSDLSMLLHRKCPLCDSTNLKGYAIDCSRRGPHISRVKCNNCKVVFANPMADKEELVDYYQNYYDASIYEALQFKQHSLDRIKQIHSYTRADIDREAFYISKYKTSGKFLDVGCGLGLGLAFANQLGFELYATEFDEGAIHFVKEHFDVNVFHGELLQAGFPDDHFDMIHISHVIEHVSDPVAYIREMYRILKKGGILSIGTPDIESNLYKWYRAFNLLQLSVPKVIDGLEHTFIFPKDTLRNLCERQGFKTREHRGVTIMETLSNLRRYKMPLKKKLARYVQNFFKVNQWLVCEK